MLSARAQRGFAMSLIRSPMRLRRYVSGSSGRRFELELAEDRPLATVRRNLMLAPEAGVPMILRGRLA